ncbi:MAG: nucleotidyltransferase domain-containing protein [Halobacteriaceae archaeon]
MGRVTRHRQIANRVADDLAANPDVDAILLVGSTASGYADEYSDVDLEVLGEADAGERDVEGVHVEWTPIDRHDLEAPLEEWTDDSRLYTYAQADLL